MQTLLWKKINELESNAGGSIVDVVLSSQNDEIPVEGVTLTLTCGKYSDTATTNAAGEASFNGILDIGSFTIVSDHTEYRDYVGNISYYGRYTVTIASKNSEFDLQTWLTAANITGTYSTLDEVLADEIAIRQLFTIQASVDYLYENSFKANQVLTDIINNRYCAKWINYREYAYSKLRSVAWLKTLMDSLGMYGMYLTSKEPRALVPVLTSDAGSDGGVASVSSSNSSSNPAYKAFDGSDNTQWLAAGTTDEYIQYNFNKPTRVIQVFIRPGYDDAGIHVGTFTVQASNNGDQWIDLYTDTVTNESTTGKTYIFKNNMYYKFYRVFILDAGDSVSGNISILTLQFYGYASSDTVWKLKGLVPEMWDYTCPYGEVSASTDKNGAAYCAFDETENIWHSDAGNNQWLQYNFVCPTCVQKFDLKTDEAGGLKAKLQASNDGTTWTDLTSVIDFKTNDNLYTISIDNTDYYLYYRLTASYSYYVSGDSKRYVLVKRLQFYGRQFEALIPNMTGDTTPKGNVTYSSIYSDDYSGWRAFDGDLNSPGHGPAATDEFGSAYTQYAFVNPTKARYIALYMLDDANNKDFVYKLEASNDGQVYATVVDKIEVQSLAPIKCYKLTTSVAFKYYRLVYVSNSVNDIAVGGGIKFQLYGDPNYDERTYIYDHGVELDSALTLVKTANANCVKNSDNIRAETLPLAKADNSVFAGMYIYKSVSNLALAAIDIRQGISCLFSIGSKKPNTASGNKWWQASNWLAYVDSDFYDGIISDDKQTLDISAQSSSRYIFIGVGYSSEQYIEIEGFWLESK